MAAPLFVVAGCAGPSAEPRRRSFDPEPSPEPVAGSHVRARSTGEFGRLTTAIRRFAADRAGRLPTRLEELTTERSPEGDRYLTSIPTDPFGRPFAYAVVSPRLGAYDLRSYGPDTLPGTDDDLVADADPVPVR